MFSLSHSLSLSFSLSPSLLRSCHGVLYKQLSSWIVHGSLRDDFNEFFIATAPAPPPVRGEEEEEEEEVQEKQVRTSSANNDQCYES